MSQMTVRSSHSETISSLNFELIIPLMFEMVKNIANISHKNSLYWIYRSFFMKKRLIALARACARNKRRYDGVFY